MKGLSLLETVVAGALVLLLGVALLSAMPTALWAISQSEALVQADQVAQSTLDTQQARPFAQQVWGSVCLPEVRGAEGVFHPELEVFPIPDADPELLKGLRVKVWWEARGGRRQVIHELWISGLPRS